MGRDLYTERIENDDLVSRLVNRLWLNGRSTHKCIGNAVIGDDFASNVRIRAVVLLGAACALNRVFAIGENLCADKTKRQCEFETSKR